jgi:hypothetical protein
MSTMMKTAVATSPSMCQNDFCEKEAVKLLVIQPFISAPDVTEKVFCYECFDKVISGYSDSHWISENL